MQKVAALGDIGTHFPDSDEHFAGADSIALLRHVVTLLGDAAHPMYPRGSNGAGHREL